MRLNHLGLPVTDEARSRRFYETYFGFDPATAQRHEDGTVIIRDAHGFDLALHPLPAAGPGLGAPAPFLHFGFGLPDAQAVREMKSRLETEGVPIIEWEDEPAYTAFKCLDPDGHRVEVYWEPPVKIPASRA